MEIVLKQLYTASGINPEMMTVKANSEEKHPECTGTNLEEDDSSLRQLYGRHCSHSWTAVMFPQSQCVHEENASEINSSHRIHKHLSLNKLIKSDFKGSVMQRGLQIEQCTVFIKRAWGKSNAVIKC